MGATESRSSRQIVSQGYPSVQYQYDQHQGAKAYEYVVPRYEIAEDKYEFWNTVKKPEPKVVSNVLPPTTSTILPPIVVNAPSPYIPTSYAPSPFPQPSPYHSVSYPVPIPRPYLAPQVVATTPQPYIAPQYVPQLYSSSTSFSNDPNRYSPVPIVHTRPVTPVPIYYDQEPFIARRSREPPGTTIAV